MHVGLVAPVWCSVPPVGYGGTEQVVDALARGLVELGHDVLLAATGDSTCPVPTRSLLPRPTNRMGDVLSELRHVLFAADALAGCDVVHDHTLAGPLLAARRTAGPPFVTTCHGVLDSELCDYYRRLGVPVLAISHAQAARSPGTTRAVVHHGVVPSDFPVGDGGGGYLLFLGRMSPDKGAHLAVAVARAAGVPLRIAAKMREPAELDYFDEHVRPVLSPAVEFLGEVAGEDKLRLLGGARALLMPIRWPEPFGMVMVEALACGTPVIALAEGAAPEVVEHGSTGFLCADEDAMTAAVGRLDALDRAACRASVEQRFSARRMAADHVRVYSSLLAERVARTPQLEPPRQPGDLDAAARVDLDVDVGAGEGDAAHDQ